MTVAFPRHVWPQKNPQWVHPLVASERGEMAIDPAVETERDEYLLAQVREVFGRVVYSHKTHEKQADLRFRRHRVQQAALVVFTAASAGTFLAALTGNFVSPQIASLVTSFVALIVTALTLATKSFKFGEESEAHPRHRLAPVGRARVVPVSDRRPNVRRNVGIRRP